MDKITKQPVALVSAYVLLGLVLALWIARAPTSFTGQLWDKFPIELNAIYIIIFGPIVAAACAAGLWGLIANGRGGKSAPLLLSTRRAETTLLATIFVLIFVFLTVLSLQYSLILAPENQCPSRPHFDFLWTSVPGLKQIAHCMSGTEEINKKAPYYLEPQILQSWGHVLWPILTFLFLAKAWRAWNNMPSS